LNIDFNKEIPRAGTHSSKYDTCLQHFGSDDVLPLSVADMDFAAPLEVTQALQQRAAHPIYGYSIYPESLYQAFMDWTEKRHGWKIEREWILLSPGVVPSLFATVLAFTRPKQNVIIQPPVYPPFFQAVTTNDRVLLENSLRLVQGSYQIDWEHLESCAHQAKLLLFCSPQNPTGRVFTATELKRLLAITKRHDLIILSDEIHADLIYPHQKHLPLGLLNQEQIISAFAPSKTFNIPGMNLSVLVIPNQNHRAKMQQVFDSLHIGGANPFSITAFEAAYRYGENWLDQLLIYLDKTKDFVASFLQQEIPQIKLVSPQGTFLLWLDCRELKMTDSELKNFFVHQAKCGLLPGIAFGQAGSGFMRMNIAAPRRVIVAALQQIRLALAKV
jgi:cystathionine beta-lyase